MDYKELLGEAQAKFTQAREILSAPDAAPDAREKAKALIAEAQAAKSRIEQLQEIERQVAELKEAGQKAQSAAQGEPGEYAKLNEFVRDVVSYGDIRNPQRGLTPQRLAMQGRKAKAQEADENASDGLYNVRQQGQVKSQWGEGRKTMVENVGSLGGFTVPEAFVNDVIGVTDPFKQVFANATEIQIAGRSARVPALDQTGSTAGKTNWFGGVVGKWTEEAAQKTEQNMLWRQIVLALNKLVCLSYISDELLEDNAIGLTTFLTGPMGFRGAIQWQSEYAFLRGTGVGMPQGVVGAGATISVAAATAAGFTWADALNMLESFLPGANGVWVFNQRLLSNVYSMVDTAGNALFTPNINQGAPGMLYGYPVLFSDKLPAPGTAGCALLLDPRYYYIGKKGAPVFSSTNAEKFSYDQTSVRAVYRIDGQPGLSAPITLEDGTTQISPFVQLGAKLT